MSHRDQDLLAETRTVAAGFDIDGRLEDVGRLGSGHIHDTFLLRYAGPAEPLRVVLQRINDSIFSSPLDVMRNIARVTDHLRAGLAAERAEDAERRCLRLLPTLEGRDHVIDDRGAFWRAYPFVEGSVALDVAPTLAHAFQAARGFGDFVARLADLAPEHLIETLPGFHDLDARVDALARATEANAAGRDLASCNIEVRHASERHQQIGRALAGIGALPRRVVHNDCKLNNVLLDAHTGVALCVIDLDTVMEGTLLADFGDLVRTAATPAAEDERDLTRVRFDLDRFDALAKGYIAGLGNALSAEEQQALPLAGPTLALENAVRFLKDHLDGDVYFPAQRQDHNLDRARCQLRLCDVMLSGLQEARARVDAAAGSSATAG